MNLCVLLDMAADAFPDRVLVGGRQGGVTAKELRRVSIAGAAQITGSGVDAVVYLGVNGPGFPAALFAAARAGVPLVPINYRLSDEQLRPLLAKHANSLILTDPSEINRFHGADERVCRLDTWLAEISAAHCDATEPPQVDSPAVIIYTSGTTSTPKGVVIRHANLMSYVFGSVEFGCAAERDAALISLPPYHIAAVANALTNVFAGRRTVVLEQFSASTWLDTVRHESITNALIVPTMLARIVGAEGVDLDVPSLRSLAYGGASMPAHVITAAMEAWQHVDFVNAYGLTETSSTIAVLGPDDHRAAFESDDPAVRARLGSAGRVLPSIELEIRDEAGAALPVGEVGRIWVRGDQVSGEYAGIGKAVDPEGWFDTRDRGHLDEEGFLFVGGRTDDTIIRGAENIAPAEIEDVLLAHPGIDDAVVVGVPDEEWGQHIEAAVVLHVGTSLTPAQLREYVRSHLRSSKTPDRIEVWDELPRTATGKILRRNVLKRLVEQESARVTI